MEATVVIAEDDPNARLVLKRALEQVEGVEVVGEAANGKELVELVVSLKPAVVFIDVEMPEMDGIQAAQQVFDINPQVIMVFCTAYPQYMSEAFDVYAFDYLVKPFKVERLRKTMDKILERLEEKRRAASALRAENLVVNDVIGRLAVRVDRSLVFVNLKEIIMITRFDRKTVIHTVHGPIYTNEPLSVMEQRLTSKLFMRTHKGYIINLNMLKELLPWGRSTYLAKLSHTSETALVTEEKAHLIQKRFKVVS